jgi:starch-binding outer membrane protein SusE/F
MKNFLKSILAILFIAFTISSCDKKNDLVTNANGNASVLSASVAALAPAPADSNNVALTFSWTSPNYAQDANLYKYVLQIDTAGRNFAKATTKTITGVLKNSFTAKEVNALALSYGFNFNVAYGMEARVISSYANNNEQYMSNVVKFQYTPYKVPPKIALPTSGKLFLVGDASQGGWNNPVPAPSQEFARLDETTFGGVFNIIGGKQYLVLPVNGDWAHKFSIADGSLPAATGDFGYDLPTNFNGPATSGWYKIILDFQTGKYFVTPFTGVLPNNLFIVGDATAGSWNNPVPVPSQQLTRLNSSVFKTNLLPLTGGKDFLLLPVNGDWSNKYSLQDNSLPGITIGGDFGYNLPQNFKGPLTTGNYTITVNFVTGKFAIQ